VARGFVGEHSGGMCCLAITIRIRPDHVKSLAGEGIKCVEISEICSARIGSKTVMPVSILSTQAHIGAHFCCLRTIFVIKQFSQSPCLGVLNNSAAQWNSVNQAIAIADCGGHHRF
jgi:hypothetical protein